MSSADDPEHVYRLYRRGSAFLHTGHPGQAALLLERAARLAPDKTSIREALGRAQFALGRWDEAAASFALVVETHPDNDYALFGLARALLAAGRPAEALGPARLALAMKPACDDYRAALVRCCERLETVDEESGEEE